MVSKTAGSRAPTPEELRDLIAVARGDEPGDLLLTNGRLVDLFTGCVREATVLIHGDRIAGVGSQYTEAKERLDLQGACLVPGLIDGHVHVESSHLTVAEFARAVLARGTTSVVIDPHEIANVLGLPGIRYMLEAGRTVPLDVFIMVPSCVPATPLETAGAVLGEREIREALGYEGVIGLAEMMNFPGVISGQPDVLRKLTVAREMGVIIDGHAPGVRGSDLNAYVASGISSDHECTSGEEAEEKLRAGMWVMIREGSAAKNLADLLPRVNEWTSRRCLFVTDDRHPEDLRREGHIDYIIRGAVLQGMDPILALRMATLNTAEYFGLSDRGAIAPGRIADLCIVNDLREFRVDTVIKSGKIVVREGQMCLDFSRYDADAVRGTVHLPQLAEGAFRIEARGTRARVIGVMEDQIVTRCLVEDVRSVDGGIPADTNRDILKITVVERHGKNGNIGLGLVRGFGLKTGAVASSVAHDSHNIIAVGVDDGDLLHAVRAIGEMDGGFVVVSGGRIMASLPLPIAGLLSDQPLEKVCRGLEAVHRAAGQLGSRLKSPFTTLSFLALPVIPELKLTDTGLVDVSAFRHVDLFVD